MYKLHRPFKRAAMLLMWPTFWRNLPAKNAERFVGGGAGVSEPGRRVSDPIEREYPRPCLLGSDPGSPAGKRTAAGDSAHTQEMRFVIASRRFPGPALKHNSERRAAARLGARARTSARVRTDTFGIFFPGMQIQRSARVCRF
ncbi:hypothetical protein EYF80_063806 [Liparis tanakae]|uniref:Uncharacterized protein n=1 Tax=Liparis tanakae TaxID=230148 RepID=A0A4Z2EB72_9TELE|nr:hypothetical protein EYF80_063806 [Liparis tanakae]